MKNKDIETAVRARSYQSPGRARAAISRSHLSPKKKARLGELVTAWESEGEDPVIGGLPESNVADNGQIGYEPELVPGPRAKNLAMRLFSSTVLEVPWRVHLNARVRVRLTPYGVTLLYQARDRVPVPEDLLERAGVWETDLRTFMSVLGQQMHQGIGDVPTADNTFEILDPRTGGPVEAVPAAPPAS